jgi:hypothetical protein
MSLTTTGGVSMPVKTLTRSTRTPARAPGPRRSGSGPGSCRGRRRRPRRAASAVLCGVQPAQPRGLRPNRGAHRRPAAAGSALGHGLQSPIAIITSDTLTTALTSLRSAMPRSLTASSVIEEAIRWPPAPTSPRPGKCGRPSQAPGYKR